jgi:uncharacterized protein involved in outer membrane biogenesis
LDQASPAHDKSDSRIRRSRVRGWGGVALAFLRAHLLIIGICAALLLTYTLAGFLLVPRIARSQLDSFVTQTLKQRVTLGELRFNPFTFEISAHELRLTDPQGGELVGFRHLYVDAELASVWQRAAVLREVDLAAPSVQLVVRPNGTVNLSSLRPPPISNKKLEEDDRALPVRIGTFALRDGRVGVEDHSRAQPFFAIVEPIRFALRDFATDAGHRNGYQFAGTTSRGERLSWNGAFTVQPLGSTGAFSIGGLQAKTLKSYMEESLPFQLVSGEANLSGSYRFELEPLILDVTLPTIAIRNLALAERAAVTSSPVQIEAIELQQLTLALDRRDVRVKSMDVRGAHIDVAREADGTISLDRLLASNDATPANTMSSRPRTVTDPTPWRTAIDAVRIENAGLVMEDRTTQPAARFELSALNASIADWHNGADATVQVVFDVGINGSAKLAASGSMQIEPLVATGKIDLTRFDLTTLQPYVAQSARMTVHSGALDITGNVRFDSTQPDAEKTQFDGDVRVANFRTSDMALKQDFINWRELSLTGIAYKSEPESLAIERIAASQPYANVIIAEDGSLNVAQVLSTESDSDTTPKSQTVSTARPSSSMPMSVRLVQIDKGSANFADRSIQPSFAAKIVGLEGKVTGLSSKSSSRAKVALTGKVDEYAPVDITGDINPLAATKYTNLAMNFRNMELTTFNPYSGKFAGYNISKGKLSTELKYRIEDRKLQAEHHIVLDNLEFGAKTDSKDAAPIPIKLGVALLKDRNGVIDINLPVSGTLDDPKFRIGPIVWKAIVNLLTKIVTAPFAALGALFGGGDELAYIDFPPGFAELTASETEKLGKLSKALTERPALRLDVPTTLVSAADTEALAKAALAERIPDDFDPEASDETTQRKRLVSYEIAYRALMNSSPAYPDDLKKKDVALEAKQTWIEAAMLAKLQPDTSALDALARERARAVQDALLSNSEIQPERIFITTDRVATATPEGEIRMELKIE